MVLIEGEVRKPPCVIKTCLGGICLDQCIYCLFFILILILILFYFVFLSKKVRRKPLRPEVIGAEVAGRAEAGFAGAALKF